MKLARFASLATATIIAAAIGSAATPARADDHWRHHERHEHFRHHHRDFARVYIGPGYGYAPAYAYAPGYVYAPPPVVYAPPPVVYAPPAGVNFVFPLHIH
jgi:hypothetical protein